MKRHLQYLRYVLRHKLYVFQECIKLGLFWAGIWHDMSKFRPDEWVPYADWFYGGGADAPEYNYGDAKSQLGDMHTRPWYKRRFDEAWNHHQKRNPHHYQYWLLTMDSGETVTLEMPDRYRREMLADWRGAGRAINGRDETLEWYTRNRENMILHPSTRAWIEHQLVYAEP